MLFPASDALPPSAVVHFVGGAFVGASPQLAYRLLLERICSKGFVIVATPYSMSFDHLRIAVRLRFSAEKMCAVVTSPPGRRPSRTRCSSRSTEQRALWAIQWPAFQSLASVRCIHLHVKLPGQGGRADAPLAVAPSGHSMGALAHCLVAARYNVTRAGNVLLSFNNKPATDAIPLFLPVVAPLAQGLNPLLTSWATSPLRGGVDMIQSQLRHVPGCHAGKGGPAPGPARCELSRLPLPQGRRASLAARAAAPFRPVGATCAGRDLGAAARPVQGAGCFGALGAWWSAAAEGWAVPQPQWAGPELSFLVQGRTEFTPAPTESARLMRTFYSVRRNLLVKFTDDSIDETASLAAILQDSAAASTLDLTVWARPPASFTCSWRLG